MENTRMKDLLKSVLNDLSLSCDNDDIAVMLYTLMSEIFLKAGGPTSQNASIQVTSTKDKKGKRAYKPTKIGLSLAGGSSTKVIIELERNNWKRCRIQYSEPNNKEQDVFDAKSTLDNWPRYCGWLVAPHPRSSRSTSTTIKERRSMACALIILALLLGGKELKLGSSKLDPSGIFVSCYHFKLAVKQLYEYAYPSTPETALVLKLEGKLEEHIEEIHFSENLEKNGKENFIKVNRSFLADEIFEYAKNIPAFSVLNGDDLNESQITFICSNVQIELNDTTGKYTLTLNNPSHYITEMLKKATTEERKYLLEAALSATDQKANNYVFYNAEISEALGKTENAILKEFIQASENDGGLKFNYREARLLILGMYHAHIYGNSDSFFIAHSLLSAPFLRLDTNDQKVLDPQYSELALYGAYFIANLSTAKGKEVIQRLIDHAIDFTVYFRQTQQRALSILSYLLVSDASFFSDNEREKLIWIMNSMDYRYLNEIRPLLQKLYPDIFKKTHDNYVNYAGSKESEIQPFAFFLPDLLQASDFEEDVKKYFKLYDDAFNLRRKIWLDHENCKRSELKNNIGSIAKIIKEKGFEDTYTTQIVDEETKISSQRNTPPLLLVLASHHILYAAANAKEKNVIPFKSAYDLKTLYRLALRTDYRTRTSNLRYKLIVDHENSETVSTLTADPNLNILCGPFRVTSAFQKEFQAVDIEEISDDMKSFYKKVLYAEYENKSKRYFFLLLRLLSRTNMDLNEFISKEKYWEQYNRKPNSSFLLYDHLPETAEQFLEAYFPEYASKSKN